MKARGIHYLFILPALIYIVIFGIYPTIYNVILSLKDVSLITYIRGSSRFIGLSNYIKVIRDPVFHRTLVNTIIFTALSIFFQMLIGFLLALLFQYDFPLKSLLQSLIMIPWVIPIIVSGSFFKWFFSDNGMLNNFLVSLGLIHEPIRWITSESLAIFSLTFATYILGFRKSQRSYMKALK